MRLYILILLLFCTNTFALNQKDITEEMLFKAVSFGNINIVESWIYQKKNINTQDFRGNTPILIAAENGHDSIVDLLIKYKADINIQNKYGYTPMLAAMANGHLAAVSSLAAAGADMKLANKYGTSPETYLQTYGAKDIHDFLKLKAVEDLKPNVGPNISYYLKYWQKDYLKAKYAGNTSELLDLMVVNSQSKDSDANELYGLYLLSDNKTDAAIQHLLFSANTGKPLSMHYLGNIFYDRGEIETAYTLYCDSTTHGDLSATAKCGEGFLYKEDAVSAQQYFDDLYAMDFPRFNNYEGLYYKGLMQYYGMGIPVNKAEGLSNVRKAAYNKVLMANKQLKRFATEEAFEYLIKFNKLTRATMRSYLVSQGALLAEKNLECDTYRVDGYFDDDYGIKSIKLCYPEKARQTMNFTISKDISPFYKQYLDDFSKASGAVLTQAD